MVNVHECINQFVQESQLLSSVAGNAQRLAAIAMSAGALVGGLAAAPAAAKGPVFPKTVEHVFDRDTVYLGSLGCSGVALHEARGSVVGVETAEHCSLRDETNERIEGSDGKTYIIQPSPVLAQTGREQGHLKTVAQIDRFIVPNTADNNHDLIIGIAEGHTEAQALKAERKSNLPESALSKLKFGDQVYEAGWPAYQPRNPGPMRRQDFSMRFLGLGQAEVSDTGQKLAVAWAGDFESKDGAETSFGDSGAGTFVMYKRRPRFIGVASATYDLTDSVPGFDGADLPPAPGLPSNSNGLKAATGFSYDTSEIPKGATILHSVRSGDQIPGYESPDEAMAAARAAFKNPDIPKTLVNGVVVVESTSDLKGGPPFSINSPVIFHDVTHENTVIAWADPLDPDHLAFKYVEDRNLYSIIAYPLPGAATVDFGATSGTETYEPEVPGGQTTGDFIDSQQHVFGALYIDLPTVTGNSYQLTSVNGSLRLAPASMK
jgi:hypothetical protein